VNVGAAGTFVARRRVTVAELAGEIPVGLDVAIRPAAEVLKLVDAGQPEAPPGTLVLVSVLVGPAKSSPRLPLELPAGKPWAIRVVAKRGPYVISLRHPERQRGLYVNEFAEKAFGARATTRGWPTFERIATAIRSLESPATRARR